MEPKEELVKSWLDKAQRDLDSAVRLTTGPDPFFDIAVYHCQQAAEKAIKGWLVQKDQRFEKIHDLRLLVTIAQSVEPKFEELYDMAERLTPYATIYRYPGEALLPDIEEFNRAIQDTKRILRFVLENLD
jgi:HEPN domain-containing protein